MVLWGTKSAPIGAARPVPTKAFKEADGAQAEARVRRQPVREKSPGIEARQREPRGQPAAVLERKRVASAAAGVGKRPRAFSLWDSEQAGQATSAPSGAVRPEPDQISDQVSGAQVALPAVGTGKRPRGFFASSCGSDQAGQATSSTLLGASRPEPAQVTYAGRARAKSQGPLVQGRPQREPQADPAAVPEWKKVAFAAPRAGERPQGFSASCGSEQASQATSSAPFKLAGCWFFGQGMCAKGAACTFSHDAELVAIAVMQGDASIPVCWYYERGMCGNGLACAFKHEGAIPQNKRLNIPEEEQDDEIYTAVKLALAAAAASEGEEEIRKMRGKMVKYARDAALGLEHANGPPDALIHEYADNFFGKIFQGLGERQWLSQVDLLLVLAATVKELLPADVIAQEEPDEVDVIIFKAHDRALDEQRCLPALWERVQQMVQGPKTRSKVYKACEAGRKAAVSQEDVCGAEDFAKLWISGSILRLRAESQGYPETVLAPDVAVPFFELLFEAGTLPEARLSESGPPDDGWHHFVTELVAGLYGSTTARQEL